VSAQIAASVSGCDFPTAALHDLPANNTRFGC